MLVKLLKPDFELDNDRGKLTQLVHDGWKQINVISSKANSVRGGHYHKYNDEGFYIISGTLKLTLQKDDTIEDYIFKNGDMFMISPYQIHTFEFQTDTILVSMYSNGVEISDNEKDIWVN